MEKENLEDIYNGELELCDEEKEMGDIVCLMNAYNIYYNKLFSTKGGFFENIDFSKATSTNNKIDKFYKEIKKFKNNKHNISRVPINNSYCLMINNENFYCTNIIPLLTKIIKEKDWIKKDWTINN